MEEDDDVDSVFRSNKGAFSSSSMSAIRFSLSLMVKSSKVECDDANNDSLSSNERAAGWTKAISAASQPFAIAIDDAEENEMC